MEQAKAERFRASLPAPEHRSPRQVKGCLIQPAAQLPGADLTRAELDWADLTGARLTGARLFKAGIQWTAGLDLSGTEVHPFFQQEPSEAVGELRFLDLGTTNRPARTRPPRSLVATQDGRLLWLTGQWGHLHLLGPSGSADLLAPHRRGFEQAASVPSWAELPLRALVQDAEGRIWGATASGRAST